MPSYEVALIVRTALERSQMKDVLKVACKNIFDQGGVVRKMENLGLRELPHPMKAHRKINTHGKVLEKTSPTAERDATVHGKLTRLAYFCINFESSAEAMGMISNNYKTVSEIIRHGIVRTEGEPRRPCLDGPCIFGELQNPDHDRAAYTKRVLQRYKNRTLPNI